MSTAYTDFLQSKSMAFEPCGIIGDILIPEFLKDFQSLVVRRGLRLGRMAIFAACGLGKTAMQLVWADIVAKYTGGNVLLLAPLTVVDQTVREAEKFGISVSAVELQSEVKASGVYVTNYEKLHLFDATEFSGIVLDESSILKNFTGAIKQQILDFSQSIHYRLACTATPSPNDLMELGNHAEFIGVMSRVEMLATFFTHDGGDTSKWRLKGHAAKERFWEWVASWAVMLQSPADIDCDSAGYDLPALHKKAVVIDTPIPDGITSDDLRLIKENAKSLSQQRKLAKCTLEERCNAAAELIAKEPDRQWIVWCNLNDESKLLSKLIPGAVEVTGSDKPVKKKASLKAFQDGEIRVLVTKPRIAGYGQNWQSCQREAFVGLNNSFEDMYQALRRCWRFGQEDEVYAYFIQHKLEGRIVQNIARKEKQAAEMYSNLACYMADVDWEGQTATKRDEAEYSPAIPMRLPSFLIAA